MSVAVQNKKPLPPVAQALMGGRLVHITTQGMYPTLKSGDTVAFDSRAYLDRAPQRGDIVLFVAPDSGGHVFVKRIIAIPLDRLRITNGVVFINGRQVSEPYVTEPWTLDVLNSHTGAPAITFATLSAPLRRTASLGGWRFLSVMSKSWPTPMKPLAYPEPR